jgi:acyl-CoA synthetase (NDP forming)
VGLDLPDFSPGTKARLRELLPEFATPQNPLDTTGYVVIDPTIMPRSQQVVAEDPHLDLLVVNASYPRDAQAAEAMGRYLENLEHLVRDSPIPVIPMGLFAVEQTAFTRQWRRERALPFAVESFSLGLPALAHTLWWAGRRRDLLDDSQAAPAPVRVPVPAQDRHGTWTEHRAAALLREAGIPVVPSVLALGPDDAVAAARDLGYPVALKVSSSAIVHKTDVGGVRLGLSSDRELRDAAESMLQAVAAAAPAAPVDGLLVSPMRAAATELLVGVVRDPTWGPVMAVALGGIWAEALGDAALARLPVSRHEARRMLTSLRGAPLLRGARGRPGADLDAVAAVIERLSSLALACGPDLAELEVNPLRVDGSSVEALDAMARWDPGLPASDEPVLEAVLHRADHR